MWFIHIINITAWTEKELAVVKKVFKESRQVSFKAKCEEAALKLPGRNWTQVKAAALRAQKKTK